MVLFLVEPVTREEGVWLWLSFGLLLGWFDDWFSLLFFFKKKEAGAGVSFGFYFFLIPFVQNSPLFIRDKKKELRDFSCLLLQLQGCKPTEIRLGL